MMEVDWRFEEGRTGEVAENGMERGRWLEEDRWGEEVRGRERREWMEEGR